eukprot:GHVS01033927.1.p1 GENE.GHVS01033927.1~~GHVS01033927.1.p1  ORF type:complete len:389 (-),score=36.24 GHVS01033927.1:1577-2743(-)
MNSLASVLQFELVSGTNTMKLWEVADPSEKFEYEVDGGGDVTSDKQFAILLENGGMKGNSDRMILFVPKDAVEEMRGMPKLLGYDNLLKCDRFDFSKIDASEKWLLEEAMFCVALSQISFAHVETTPGLQQAFQENKFYELQHIGGRKFLVLPDKVEIAFKEDIPPMCFVLSGRSAIYAMRKEKEILVSSAGRMRAATPNLITKNWNSIKEALPKSWTVLRLKTPDLSRTKPGSSASLVKTTKDLPLIALFLYRLDIKRTSLRSPTDLGIVQPDYGKSWNPASPWVLFSANFKFACLVNLGFDGYGISDVGPRTDHRPLQWNGIRAVLPPVVMQRMAQEMLDSRTIVVEFLEYRDIARRPTFRLRFGDGLHPMFSEAELPFSQVVGGR